MQTKTVSKKRELLPGLNMTHEEFKQKMQDYHKCRKFNPAIEGGELSIDELKAMVKEAEEGPFYTLEEGQKMIKQWREQRRNR